MRVRLSIASLALVVGAAGLASETAAAGAGDPESPVAFGAATDWKQVTTGTNTTCATKTTGRLFCWGSDFNGQLGDDAELDPQGTPIEVAGQTTDWQQVSVGGGQTCAVKTTGHLFCWGDDDNGQLGDDATLMQLPTPVEVDGAAADWKQVEAHANTTCAVKTTGQLFCWGDDFAGQLGDDATLADMPTPVEVDGADTDWKQVSVGNVYACAVKTTGQLFCWGADNFGQLGDDATLANMPTPVEVDGAATDWKAVSAGNAHTCALKTSRQVFCWGSDGQGRLGDDDPIAQKQTPAQLAGSNWKQVSAGASSTCAVKRTKRLFCWGADGDGELGDGATLAEKHTPVQVARRLTSWKSVSAGALYACAVKKNRRLYCWGDDGSGRLGDDATIADKPKPVQVAG